MSVDARLLVVMEAMVKHIRLMAVHATSHERICRRIADKYDLWDDEKRFPIWLSRIVEGEINDMGKQNLG